MFYILSYKKMKCRIKIHCKAYLQIVLRYEMISQQQTLPINDHQFTEPKGCVENTSAQNLHTK